MTAGQTWAQTQAMVSHISGSPLEYSLQLYPQFHDTWMHDVRSPRIHPKSMDSLLERHQAEILEDLNSLGRYSRLVANILKTDVTIKQWLMAWLHI